jgi:hypothetical protein
MDHWNVQRKSTLQIPLYGMPTIGVFCIDKIRGGQDRAFQFRGGLVYYKVHSDLSWFRPLLEGNSFTSSGLVKKTNMCYKG